MKKKFRKCCECKSKLLNFTIQCNSCSHFVHRKCIQKKQITKNFICSECLFFHLSLSQVTNYEFDQFFKDKSNLDHLPGFKIQSLIDDLKKKQNEDNSFISDSINSKYFTPSEFTQEKFEVVVEFYI